MAWSAFKPPLADESHELTTEAMIADIPDEKGDGGMGGMGGMGMGM